jgi:hypothetical protein
LNSNNTLRIIYGKKSLKENGNIFVREEDFQIPIGTSSLSIPNEELKRIQKSSLTGKRIPDLFAYKNISLWWFIYPTLFPQFKKTVNFITKFIEYADQIRPSAIRVADDFNNFDIIKQVCNKKNIRLEYSKSSFLKFKIRDKLIRYVQRYRYKKITKLKIKKRKNLFYNKYSSIPSVNNKILFVISTFYRRHIFNANKGLSEKGEYIQQSIINLLKDKNTVVSIDIDYTLKGDLHTLSERLNDEMTWFPVDILLSKTDAESYKHKKFLKNYQKVISTKEFRNLFSFCEISLWKQMENIFEQLKYAPFLPFHLNLLDSLFDFFANNKPKAIFLPYETGPIALAFIVTSKQFRIKTIGVEHAVIFKNNAMYTQDEFVSQENTYGFPLPDTMLLFGNFAKRILEEQGYPSDKLVVFGNPSFFSIDKIKSILASKSIRKKHNINESQQVILFATGMLQEYYTAQGKYDYDTRVWRHILENFGNNNEFVIILKPHPNENTSVYEKILKEFACNNARIIQGDLFELIYMSSVVVSVLSSIMVDSLCFKKPVIRVKFDNEEPVIPYDKFGVVLSSELEELSQNIRKILSDSETRNRLLKNSEQFIKDQYNVPEDKPEFVLQQTLE